MFFGIYFNFLRNFSELFLYLKLQKGVDFARRTCRANVARRGTRGGATQAHADACMALMCYTSDTWWGHASPRGRLGGAYVACRVTGSQVMGPRV